MAVECNKPITERLFVQDSNNFKPAATDQLSFF